MLVVPRLVRFDPRPNMLGDLSEAGEVSLTVSVLSTVFAMPHEIVVIPNGSEDVSADDGTSEAERRHDDHLDNRAFVIAEQDPQDAEGAEQKRSDDHSPADLP